MDGLSLEVLELGGHVETLAYLAADFAFLDQFLDRGLQLVFFCFHSVSESTEGGRSCDASHETTDAGELSARKTLGHDVVALSLTRLEFMISFCVSDHLFDKVNGEPMLICQICK